MSKYIKDYSTSPYAKAFTAYGTAYIATYLGERMWRVYTRDGDGSGVVVKVDDDYPTSAQVYHAYEEHWLIAIYP